ncbi:sensor histidine kinase [Cellulosilyticum sp. WCF-2]|uniref:sensor histidine kinase n=2 Tax=unclassified Cellulosilyticum TaxID=2643091 RepID=UPI000F8C3329|nr:GHKL domain-containing protein [Cellulosilyticum sp. WCF-2]QEH66907.1 GHKL domain-containing protein [Cellulosilyticum sp. WCF-2]
MDRLNLLAGALSCFVMQAMCLSVFLDQAQLTRKRTIRYSIYASIILAFMFISVENSKFGLLFFGICFANFLFEGKLLQKVWVNLLGLAVIYGIGTLDWMVVDSIIKDYGVHWLENQIVTEIRGTLEVTVLWLLAKQTSVIYKENGQYKRVTRRQAFTIILLTITAVYTFFICDAAYFGDIQLLKNISLAPYIMILFICIILLILGVNQEMNKLYYKWSNECMSEQLERQLKYYHKLEEVNKETRAIKHDMHNHMLIIKGLAQQGQLHKLEQYIGEMEQTTERLGCMVHTGNSIVDAILNDKLQIAKERNIQMEYEVRLSNQLTLDDMDLCVIFANSLDNAIEACERVEDGRVKKIQMKAVCDRGYFFYNIKNTANGRVEVDQKKEFPTNKKDSINHGFGLANIKKSVQKNNGNINILSKEEEFYLEIDIPVNYGITA